VIRVASYNIRKSVGLDRKRRPERIVEILNEINADVVALQEVDRRTGLRETTIPRAMIEAETDLKVVEIATRPDSIGWHGNAILVRKDAEVMVERRHDIPVLEPRGAISADILLNGQHLRIVGMHLALMRSYRRLQTAFLNVLQSGVYAYSLPTLRHHPSGSGSRTAGTRPTPVRLRT